MTTYETIKAILLEHLDIEEDAITMESSITADLSADSLDLVDILMDLEEVFDMSIPEKSIGTKIKDIVAYIENPPAVGESRIAKFQKPAKKEKLKKSA